MKRPHSAPLTRAPFSERGRLFETSAPMYKPTTPLSVTEVIKNRIASRDFSLAASAAEVEALERKWTRPMSPLPRATPPLLKTPPPSRPSSAALLASKQTTATVEKGFEAALKLRHPSLDATPITAMLMDFQAESARFKSPRAILWGGGKPNFAQVSSPRRSSRPSEAPPSAF
jgi:hypothetical protein